MRMLFRFLFMFFMLIMTFPAMAALNIFACEPEWASLANELGGERVKSYSATTAFQDPHRSHSGPPRSHSGLRPAANILAVVYVE